ncbi:MAG: hypothetical protein LUG50_16390 [Planctomycetaceae bacterium]|nr:hypothetical protein [Planctomycetaceae bacterium]
MNDEPNGSVPAPDSCTTVICILYIGFFLVWCVGLAVGLFWTGPDMPRWFGVPVWFLLGCVFSSVAVSVALVLCMRRWFK